jgi:hypothetical protein
VGGRECQQPARPGHHRAGEGSATAIALHADLVEEDTRDAVIDFRLGMPA